MGVREDACVTPLVVRKRCCVVLAMPVCSNDSVEEKGGGSLLASFFTLFRGAFGV